MAAGLLVVALALAFTGPGFVSVGQVIGLDAPHRAVWGTVAAVVAVLTSFAAMAPATTTRTVEGAEPTRP